MDGCYANWFFVPSRFPLGYCANACCPLFLVAFRLQYGWCTSQAQNLKFRAQNFDLHHSDPKRNGTPRNSREGWDCRFRKHPRTEGGGSVDPRFLADLPFPVPEIPEFVAFRDSGTIFRQLSRDFPGVFLENPPSRPRKQPQPSRVF